MPTVFVNDVPVEIGSAKLNCIQAAEILGMDDSFREELADARSKLLPYQIGKYGQRKRHQPDADVHPGELQQFVLQHLVEGELFGKPAGLIRKPNPLPAGKGN